MKIPRNVEVLLVVGSAFCVTTSLSNVLKYLFKNEGYAFPLFVTSMHMAISYFVAYVGIQHLKMNENTFRTFTKRDQVTKILPIALCTAISMGCSNLALKFLYPSFVAMVSAAIPLVTIILALIFKTEEFNVWTFISMVPIFSGLVLSSTNEVNFHFLGFCILVVAIVLRAMKQVLQARVLRDEGKIDALTLLYYVAPQNFLVFIVWSTFAEGAEPYRQLAVARGQTWAVLMLSTIFAACFNLLSFRAITLINATAWSLMGMVNAPAIAILSFLLFGNAVGKMQIIGFGVTLSGVYLYQQKGRIPDRNSNKSPHGSPNGSSKNKYQVVGKNSPMNDEFGLESDDDAGKV